MIYLESMPQGIAPTIIRLVFRQEVALGAASCIVGAIPCGRPLPSRSRLFSLNLTPTGRNELRPHYTRPGEPLHPSIVGAIPCGRPG